MTQRQRTKLSLRSVRVLGSSRGKNGVLGKQPDKVFTHRDLVREAQTAPARQRARQNAMTHEQLKALEVICQQNEPSFDMFDSPEVAMDVDDVVDGEQLDIGHGGGEYDDLARDIMGDCINMRSERPQTRRSDHRTRRDRILRRTAAFNFYMESMVQAYLKWCCQRPVRGYKKGFTEDGTDSGDRWEGVVVDVFYAEKISLVVDKGSLPASFLHHGMVPSSPEKPSVVITIDALELYRVAHHRCPHYAIQAYVKTLCDLQGVEFKSYLARQFSIALDLYLQIRERVDSLVAEALLRDCPDWNLKHCCPACTYTLQDEQQLEFKMLYAMDGNDSLKRVLRRLFIPDVDPDVLRPSSELPTGQSLQHSRYLSRAYVNQFTRSPGASIPSTNEADANPCSGRWKNMDDQKTKKTWGVFDETGVFLAVCRHGFILLIVDMVQSGELAKYPLAVVNKLTETFGTNLGGGYDIGCAFETTLQNSTVGPRALLSNHKCLVGAFHGHAHRRACQLDNLTTYVKGLGLEDLETCERTFSKSNALAGTTRHSSIFHRQQSISLYFQHNDAHEIFANLAKFLAANYRQALSIINTTNETLPKLMEDLGVTSEAVFEDWLEEEKQYLQSLKHEPEEETVQMEYLERLVKLSASKRELDNVRSTWSAEPVMSYTLSTSQTRKAETAHRHALERYEKDIQAVQELESRFGIEPRWIQGDANWEHAARLVAQREYRRALDNLEGLIVSRLFELSKMNRAGTGYKLRKHIAKALQTRSAAIRSALSRYNTAAAAISPPRQRLHWDEVVEYTFLADFDFLRDSRHDVSSHPWANAAGRLAMDSYFKRCRAQEEILRLNVEIRRLVTYIRDETRYLLGCEKAIREDSPMLAHQIAVHHNVRSRFHSSLLKTLYELAQLPGFSGTVTPGQSLQPDRGESASEPSPIIPPSLSALNTPAQRLDVVGMDAETEEDLADEEETEEDAAEALHVLQDVLAVSYDAQDST